jgi:hypothetical protein
MNEWARERRAELEAAAPTKRKKVAAFVKVPLAWAAKAAAATNTRKAMVWIWLLHRSWERNSHTITVPNGALLKYGVPRETKRRALAELEAAGLIMIERRPRKSPTVKLCL